MARRGQAVTISLFSFQDIITSVSGILIFITLMLVLELIQSVEGKPADRVARDLEAATAQAQQELDAVKAEIKRSADALAQSLDDGLGDAATPASVLEAEADADEAEIAALRDRSQQAKTRQDQAQARSLASRGDQEKLDRTLRQLQQEIEATDRERRDNRVYYKPGDAGKRERWLVEISGQRIATAPMGRDQAPRSFVKGGLFSQSPSTQFLNWCKSEAPNAYFLLLARPSGIDGLQEVQEAFRQRRQSFGFDLIGETTRVLDETRGAGAP